MKRPPMFLMMLLATALSDNFPADGAQGAEATLGKNVKGLVQVMGDEACAVEASQGTLASRLKPAA